MAPLQATEQNIFYDLPMQSKLEDEAYNTNPDAVDQWYADLPLADIRTATKEIYQALKEINSSQVSYKKRLYFMEKVHAGVIDSAENLARLNLDRNLPLDEKHQRIANLVQQLHLQMAVGYKAVLYDLDKSKFGILYLHGKKLQTLVIQRIIRHVSFSILYNYQTYKLPYKSHWPTLHHLFLRAENDKISDKTITDPSYRLKSSTTIKQTYLQILLLAIADPYHMTQQNINTIFTQLEQLAQLANLYHFKQKTHQHNLVIDLDSDIPPALRMSQDLPMSQNLWILDTSGFDHTDLVSRFEKNVHQTSEIDTALLRQLSLTWGIPPSRQHARKTASSTLKVAIGINKTYFVLNGYNEPEWLMDNTDPHINPTQTVLANNIVSTAHFDVHKVKSPLSNDDVWDKIYQDKKREPSLKEDKPSPVPEIIKNDLREGIHDWEIINESEGGYCLSWDKNEAINVKVGEIVALMHEEKEAQEGNEASPGYWTVGTIRWIKCLRNNAVQMGIKNLAPNAVAVTITRFKQRHKGLQNRAIMLPALSALNQPETIITPALGYSSGDQVLLEKSCKSLNTKLSTLNKLTFADKLDHSSHFSRFKFSFIEQVHDGKNHDMADENLSKDLALDGETKFDSLWDDL